MTPKFQIGDLVRPSSLWLHFYTKAKTDSVGSRAFVGIVVAIERPKQNLPYYRVFLNKKTELIPEEELCFLEEKINET